MPTCYPYIRFSSMKQADGESIRRQTERIDEFVKRHALTIDTRLEDFGVSSFRGKNAKKGQLGQFLQRVRDGEIEKGSYLLIENWDRLSRQVLDASIEIFSDLIRAGIKIAVLDENTVYDDLTSSSYIRAIVHFERAHGESQRKSDMSKANWKAKHKEMEDGAVVTEKTPKWIKVENGKFVVIEEIAQQIKDMFKLSLTYGLAEVGRKLNEKHGSSWKPHQIQYMLKNKRVIGWHNPVEYSKEYGKNIPTDKLLTNYYPPIIEASLFNEVQRVVENRRPFSGKQDKQNFNIFRELAYCAECGGSVRFMLKSNKQLGDKEYFYCTNSMSDACTTKGLKSIRGEHLRKLLFKFEHWTNIREFFAQHDKEIRLLETDRASINAKLERITTRINSLEQKFNDEQDEDIAETYIGLITKARKEKKELEATIADIQKRVDTFNSAYEFNGEGVAQEFESMLYEKSDKGAEERAKINRYLKTIFERIEINFTKKWLSTVVNSAFKGKVTEIQASISEPKDRREGETYPFYACLGNREDQKRIIKNIKAQIRRKGIKPEFEMVSAILKDVAMKILKTKPRRKSATPSSLGDEEFNALMDELNAENMVWEAPKEFLK